MRAFNVLLGAGAIGTKQDAYGCGDRHGDRHGNGRGDFYLALLSERPNGVYPYPAELLMPDKPTTPDAWLTLGYRLQGRSS